MNTARSVVLLATASLLLAACASTPRTANRPVAEGSGFAVDAVYVEAVNRASKEAGVTVVWINPPRPGDRKD
jgi:starvation-inducible outer membrane lipoprotein